MSRVIGRPEGKDKPCGSPRWVRVPRLSSRASRALGRVARRLRVRIAARPRVAPAQRWWTKRQWRIVGAVVSTLVVLAWVGVAAVLLLGERFPVGGWCKVRECGTAYGVISPVLGIGVGTFIFLLFTSRRVSRSFRGHARRDPRDMVPTAGTTIEEVVGRQELCNIICRALHNRVVRRPYLLVGGVGTGKTAVLVQLTQMLADKGAVPVAIRLRDVDVDDAELDFGKMAMKRFRKVVDRGVYSSQQSERVWREICMDGRAVVIADGLEETLAEGEGQKHRDIAIRHGIKRAEMQRLPLVIASRPHSPLEETEATIIDLEPLSEEAALRYLEKGNQDSDAHRMEWIVERAGISESPLYLQIARELRQHHRLMHLTAARQCAELDTRSADRSMLRLRLLETWRAALIDGHLRGELALSSGDRRKTVEVVSALACIGLLQDQLEVRFDDLIGDADRSVRDATREAPGRAAGLAAQFSGIREKLGESVEQFAEGGDTLQRRTLLSLHATRGEQLGLVDAYGDKVRFPHSVIQAYLGSRYLEVFWQSTANASILKEPGPGRELLIALILHSRAEPGDHQKFVVQLLLNAAESRTDPKAFDLYSAALQVDIMADGSHHQEIADSLRDRWPVIQVGDRRTREEAKQALVHRFGETLRAVAAATPEDPVSGTTPAYEQFLDIGKAEPAYAIRLAIAQEFGCGGDEAFDALRKMFPLPERETGGDSELGREDLKSDDLMTDDPWIQYETELHRQLDDEHEERERINEFDQGSDQEFDEENYRRLRGFGPGRDARGDDWEAHERYLDRIGRNDERRACIWRKFVMRAWLVPMMVDSVGEKHSVQARERLGLWLKHLEPEHSSTGRADLPLSLEIALAQGFKSAANRRKRHACTRGEAREHLIEQAENMLAHARYWFSQLTLIHALCLWALPDTPEDSTSEAAAGADGHPIRQAPATDARHRSKADAAQTVERWLALAGSKVDPRTRDPEDRTRKGLRLHPFVADAGYLAVLALESGHPERFLWIDETGVMEKVGSHSADCGGYRKHSLWIPPSAGWSTLHPWAQQLLADVLLLLNLTERTGHPDELEVRLRAADRAILPPCLTRDRTPFQPGRTVGMADSARPQTTCLRGCRFQLCPYPAKGESPRSELREPFCRQQQELLRAYRWWWKPLSLFRRKTAPWQGMTRSELIRFWGEMADRSRTPSTRRPAARTSPTDG